MSAFSYRDGALFAEEVPVARIAAEHGTPCYIYSSAALRDAFSQYQQALSGCDHLVCYAVKTNSNIAVLQQLAALGAGFDIVSVGELERVIAAGGDPSKVVFSGVTKKPAEMARALEVGIACFNVESPAELEALQSVAEQAGCSAPVSVRVNPDVDAQTHPYISTGLKENKFGIAMEEALAVYQRAKALPNIHIVGLDCHIGSQLTQLSPFIDALERLLVLIDTLDSHGITIEHLDLGGGLGVVYKDEEPPSIEEYVAAIRQTLGNRPLKLVFEPGRSIAANAGLLIMQVEYLKPTQERHFALVDAAMNDMIRPALYQAWLDVQPVLQGGSGTRARWDIVGPVCETGDFLAKDRDLTLHQGQLLAMFGAGAYGFTMSSNYNSRPRAPEIMVRGDQAHVVRARESIEDLLRSEQCLPDTD